MSETSGDGPSSSKDDVGNNTFSFFMEKMQCKNTLIDIK